MANIINRVIARIRNGLQLDGKESSTGAISYLQDKDGNDIYGVDANGNPAGKGFTPRTQAVTASDDGLTTGIIKANVDFVTVTSAGATKAVSLPAASASTVGRVIRIFVGSNGFELITGADGNTINGADADGTNQLDVAANSLVTLVQVSATGWYSLHQTTSAVSVVGADND